MNEKDFAKVVNKFFKRLEEAKTDDFVKLLSIAGLDLKEDLSGADLRKTTLDQINFKGADLCFADLTEASLIGSNLSEVNFKGAILRNADLRNSTMIYTNFEEADLRGANFIGANLRSVNLENANIEGCNIQEVLHSAITVDPSSDPDKIVLLAGAGASSPLGLPTLKGIWSSAAYLKIPLDSRIAGIFRDIWEIFRESDETPTFEDLIARLKIYIETANVVAYDHFFRKILIEPPAFLVTGKDELKNALTECYRILLQLYGPENTKTKGYEYLATIAIFKELSRLNNGRLHIFTTNYDCSLNVIASKSDEIKFVTHIDNQTGHFKENWHCVRPELKNKDLPITYIHRLHGCVAWFAEDNYPFKLIEVYGAGGKLEISDPNYLHKMCISIGTLPNVKKNPALALAFDEFYEQLTTCKILLVWGYSFRDPDLLNVIQFAVRARKEPLNIFLLDTYLSADQAKRNIQNFSPNPFDFGRAVKISKIKFANADGLKELADTIIMECSNYL